MDPAKGKFRSYLLGSVKHFLARIHEERLTAKRGGGVTVLSLDSSDDAEQLVEPCDPAPPPDAAFDRSWAMAVIAGAVAALEAEWTSAGRANHWNILSAWLPGGHLGSQSDAAAALGLSDTAMRVAIHRLRLQFRDQIRAIVAATLDDPDDLDDEIRHLIAMAALVEDCIASGAAR